MLDRISNPEKFIDAERAGADWVKAQRKECGGFLEIVRSYFSLKSTDHNPLANFVFKYNGTFVAGSSMYHAQFLENADKPLFVGGILLIWGIMGASTTVMGTRDSMDRRKIERQRKLARSSAA